MKKLRIFLIILVPVFGLVSCQKTDIVPKSCGTVTTEQPAETAPVNGRLKSVTTSSVTISEQEPIIDEIVGSGDDDRDGGDKKAKAAGK